MAFFDILRKTGQAASVQKTQHDVRIDEQGRTVFTPRLDEDEQIRSTFNMVGDGLETRGGVSLMLTEAVENSADAIIEARKKGHRCKGEIRIVMDQPNKRVLVIDDGFGFQNVRHVSQKPFKSLKRADADYTGQFARGLQGFRAFCNKLTFYTRRANIPLGELDYIPKEKNISNQTVKIEYNEESIKVAAKHVDDKYFAEYADTPQGSVAIYEIWKKGQFEKLPKESVIKRIEHHFGELIRDGEIKIFIHEEQGKIKGLGPTQSRWYECKPKNYSQFERIELKPISYIVNGEKRGVVDFNLFLTKKGRSDRWLLPFLMWRKRPVGDGHIRDSDDFRDNPVWSSQFLTGYVAADFCKINSLRTALETGDELDFLYQELQKAEKKLEKAIKKHSQGVWDLKFKKQMNELVVDLQRFVKDEKILDFSKARNKGILPADMDELTAGHRSGDESDTHAGNTTAEVNGTAGLLRVENANVDTSEPGEAFGHQTEVGGHAGDHAETKEGGPGETALSGGRDQGYERSGEGVTKPYPDTNVGEGEKKTESQKKTNRPRHRGIGLETEDNEFNDEPSWFESVTSTVVINSGHDRYMARYNMSEGRRMKDLMNYMAELYLWEITKRAFKDEPANKLGSKFLDLKFKYFETSSVSSKVSSEESELDEHGKTSYSDE